MPDTFGKTLIIVGLVIVAAGCLFLWHGSIPFLGKLPGDIHFKRDGLQVYFPIVTCIVLSVVVSLLVRLFR